MPKLQPKRPRSGLYPLSWSAARRVVAPGLAAAALLLAWCGTARAQGGVPLITVATDQSPLNLSQEFGIPTGVVVNQGGDFAFVGSGDTGLFLRLAGAASATRLLQIDDEMPGFAGSRVSTISPELSLNASRQLLFGVGFTGSDHQAHEALLTYDAGAMKYQTLVTSDQNAPNGTPYGLDLVPGSLDDAGDMDFIATAISGSPTPTISGTLYILPAGASAPRVIVGPGSTPPAACTWCVNSSNSVGSFFPGTPVGAAAIVGDSFRPVVPALTAQGKVLLSLWGGLFVGSKDGTLSLVPMASSGPCSPSTQTTTPILITGIPAFLNNSGAVAFSNPLNSAGMAICVFSSNGSAPTPLVSNGDAAPNAVGGGTISSPLALGFDDSGDIVYQSLVLGSTVTSFGLFRRDQASAQADAVAYACEPAPGAATGSVFGTSTSVCGAGSIFIATSLSPFQGVSIAKDGTVSFNASLSTGGNAIYRQAPSGNPEFLAAVSDTRVAVSPSAISVSLPGTAFLGAGQTEILNGGSVFFESLPTSGPADFAAYLGAPGNVQTLMSTTDTLPSGAVTLLGPTPPRAAGHFVAFTAQPAAGRNNLLEADLTSGAITHVVSDNDHNDPALTAAGGPAKYDILTSSFFPNPGGQIALETSLENVDLGVGFLSIGSPANSAWQNFSTNPCGAIYLWSPSGGLAKVAAPGDAAPGSNGTFACLTLNFGFPTPLNSAGQVVFASASSIAGLVPCPLCGLAPASGADTLFLYTPAAATAEIAGAGDTVPGQAQSTSFVPLLSEPVNSSGTVAFGAQLGASTAGQGLFLRQVSGSVQGVMSYGQTIPDTGGTFGFPHFIAGLTDSGNLAFTAATNSALDGLFFTPAGGATQTLALDGGAAPGGGQFSLVPQLSAGTLQLPPSYGNFAQMNNESDVAFGALLTGGGANSGLFRAVHSVSGVGTLQAIALQGQTAPGGGTFSFLPASFTAGSEFALGPDGALAFTGLVSKGSTPWLDGMFVAKPDGTVVKVVETGDTVPGGGLLEALAFAPKLAGGDAGEFTFLTTIEGGAARRMVFVTAIAPGTAATTTALSSLPNPVVAQQPLTLTATVTSTAPGTPGGSVTFFSNGISLGSGSLNGSGQASVMTSALAAGPDSIVAQYAGDANFAADNSAPMAIVAAGFAPAPASLSVTAGQNLVVPLTVYAPAGSNLNFTLSCSGLPANSSCAFDTNPVVPSATGTIVKLTLATMAGSILPPAPSQKDAPFRPVNVLATLSAAVMLAFALAALAGTRAPRLRLAGFGCCATLAFALALTGCGAIASSGGPGLGSSGTPPGLTTFTANGTSGSTTISVTVKVMVQQ